MSRILDTMDGRSKRAGCATPNFKHQLKVHVWGCIQRKVTQTFSNIGRTEFYANCNFMSFTQPPMRALHRLCSITTQHTQAIRLTHLGNNVNQACDQICSWLGAQSPKLKIMLQGAELRKSAQNIALQRIFSFMCGIFPLVLFATRL